MAKTKMTSGEFVLSFDLTFDYVANWLGVLGFWGFGVIDRGLVQMNDLADVDRVEALPGDPYVD